MRNIAMTLKYLGTAYHGWQVQKNGHDRRRRRWKRPRRPSWAIRCI